MKADEANASTKAWTRKITVSRLLVGLLIVTAILIAFLKMANREDLLGGVIVGALLFALGMLSHRFKRIDRTINKVFSAYFLFAGWMMITLGPLTLFNWLSQLILQNLAVRFQIVVFVAWGLLLSWAVLFIFLRLCLCCR